VTDDGQAKTYVSLTSTPVVQPRAASTDGTGTLPEQVSTKFWGPPSGPASAFPHS
jgi:hypothetical protein